MSEAPLPDPEVVEIIQVTDGHGHEADIIVAAVDTDHTDAVSALHVDDHGDWNAEIVETVEDALGIHDDQAVHEAEAVHDDGDDGHGGLMEPEGADGHYTDDQLMDLSTDMIDTTAGMNVIYE